MPLTNRKILSKMSWGGTVSGKYPCAPFINRFIDPTKQINAPRPIKILNVVFILNLFKIKLLIYKRIIIYSFSFASFYLIFELKLPV